MADIDVDGLGELSKKIEKLKKKTSPQHLRTAVQAGALPIQTAAAQKAPILTGTLRRSIHTAVYDIPDGAEARIGTGLEYAAPQEFGTSRVKAHPYLRPAFDEEKGNALREVQDVLKGLTTP